MRHVHGLDPSEQVRLRLIDVYSLATFYNCFSLKPRGKHLIKVCLGTACHLKGGTRLVENLERELGVREGEMTPDGQFTYETVRCLGCCSLAPVAILDNKYYPRTSTRKVTQLIHRIQRSNGRPTSGKSTQSTGQAQTTA